MKTKSYIQTKTTSKNMQFLKSSNRAAVIQTIARKKAADRTELAEFLNLTKMAISNIVNELIEESFIKETTILPNVLNPNPIQMSSGRRRKHLEIINWTINAICINIHRYSVSCMIMDLNGNTAKHASRTLPMDADNNFLIQTISEFIDEILETSHDTPIFGIGISSIGPLDIYQKHLLNPPDFCKIQDLQIGELLENRFQIPVFMDNDMNCSALAELYFGAGCSYRDLVFLGFSSGVGAGIIMNEKIMHGSGGFAGEVGHISINPHGAICPCGQHGCIELYTRGENLLKNIGVKNFIELNSIIKSAEPPQFVLNCLNDYIDAMHSLVVAIANSYDPEILILGDIDINFIENFIPNLEDYMNRYMLNHGYKHIKIVSSKLEFEAPLYGAGSIVFQRVFDGEIALSDIDK